MLPPQVVWLFPVYSAVASSPACFGNFYTAFRMGSRHPTRRYGERNGIATIWVPGEPYLYTCITIRHGLRREGYGRRIDPLENSGNLRPGLDLLKLRL